MENTITEGFLNEIQKSELVELYMDVLGISQIIRSAYREKVVLEHTYADVGHYSLKIWNQLDNRDEEYEFYYEEYNDTVLENMKDIMWVDILKDKIGMIQDPETFKKVKTVLCALVD